MSNEYKDWLHDNVEEEKIYPYLKISSNDSSWINFIPIGWQSRVYKLFDSINAILNDRVNDFHILDIKEKYCEFKLYWSIDCDITAVESQQIEDLAEQTRLELLSTCIICGEHTEYKYMNIPVCEKCNNNLFKRGKKK